jgi:hypothetical protein
MRDHATIFRGGFARRQLVILLAVAVAACKRDSVTAPASADGGPLLIEAVSATQLEGTVGEPVDLVPAVVVRSETGKPLPGIQVLFIPSYTSESLVRDSVTNRIVSTDSRGVASAGKWILGTTSGLHDLEARILDAYRWSTDPDRVVVFHAEAKAAAPAALSRELFFPDTVGVPGDQLSPPMIRVTDRFGNGVGGVAITFSVTSGGSVVKTHDETSRFGSASPGTWTLGVPGVNSVVASGPGLNSVTFSSRVLDVGAVTWYDLVPQSVNLIVSASIALCEDGTFELVTVDNSFGELLERQRGKYTLAGTVVVLTFATGVSEQGRLVDHSLSLMHVRSNWVNAPLEEWRFVKR